MGQSIKALGYVQLTNLAAAVGMGTIPAGTSFAIVQPETANTRWRDDGTDPTSTVGYPLAAGSELQYDAAQLTRVKFIEQSAGAKLNICFYGDGL